MTSIERTAYPRFKRLLSARELHVFFTPQPDEVAWARGFAGSDEHLLAMVGVLSTGHRHISSYANARHSLIDDSSIRDRQA